MELEQQAMPEMRVLADEMEVLRTRVDNIEILASLARTNSDRALGILPMIEPANLNRILAVYRGRSRVFFSVSSAGPDLFSDLPAAI